MSTQSQISATISSATKEELDRFTESHGLKMNPGTPSTTTGSS